MSLFEEYYSLIESDRYLNADDDARRQVDQIYAPRLWEELSSSPEFTALAPEEQEAYKGRFAERFIPQQEGGILASAKQTVGATIKGAGQFAADYIPGVSQDNPVKQYGQEVIDANPTAIKSLSDIAEKPGTAVGEAVGNAAPSMAGMLGVRAVGQGITALSPAAGPAAPAVALFGQAVSWLGPMAIAALPSYGGIRDKQIFNDPEAQESAKSKAIAALGSATVGAIETKFGPQNWALSAMTKEGRAKLAEKFAATSLPKAIGKGGAEGAAVEGAEELVQSPIEQIASGDDPTSPESLNETVVGGVMGSIGGGILGAGTGGMAYRKPTPSDILASPDIDTAIDTFTESVKSIDTKIAGIDATVKGATVDFSGILSDAPVEPTVTPVSIDGAPIVSEPVQAEPYDPRKALGTAGPETVQDSARMRRVADAEAAFSDEDTLLPRDLAPALAKMQLDMNQSDRNGVITEGLGNNQTVTGGFAATTPDWFKQETIKKFDKEHGTEYAKVVNKATVNATLRNVRDGKKLSPRFAEVWDYLQVAAEKVSKIDPEVVGGTEYDKLTKEGFEFEQPKAIPVGSINKGDEVVIDKNGIPDKLVHKGFDGKGNAILEDGVTMRVDPFELIDVVARKNSPINPEQQQPESATPRTTDTLPTRNPSASPGSARNAAGSAYAGAEATGNLREAGGTEYVSVTPTATGAEQNTEAGLSQGSSVLQAEVKTNTLPPDASDTSTLSGAVSSTNPPGIPPTAQYLGKSLGEHLYKDADGTLHRSKDAPAAQEVTESVTSGAQPTPSSPADKPIIDRTGRTEAAIGAQGAEGGAALPAESRQPAAKSEKEASPGKSFTVSRYNNESKEVVDDTFTKGETVSAWFSKDRSDKGVLSGISESRKQAKVVFPNDVRKEGVWFDFGQIYKAEQPKPVERKTVKLAKALDSVNAKNEPDGGFNDSDKVPSTAPVQPSPPFKADEHAAGVDDNSAPKKASKPRMAESPAQLYKEIASRADKGVVTSRYGIKYPVVKEVGDNRVFRITSKKVEVIMHGSVGARDATAAEIEDINRAIERDAVEVYLTSGWGGGTEEKRLDTLHSPSGNSFAPKAIANNATGGVTNNADVIESVGINNPSVIPQAGKNNGGDGGGGIPDFAKRAGVKTWMQARKKGLSSLIGQAKGYADKIVKHDITRTRGNPDQVADRIAEQIIQRTAITGGLDTSLRSLANEYYQKANSNGADPAGDQHYNAIARGIDKLRDDLNGVKLSKTLDNAESKGIYNDGFWKDFKSRNGRRYGDAGYISALLGIDKKSGRRSGVIIARQGGKTQALDAIRWDNDLAGENYVSAAGEISQTDGTKYFRVSFIPTSLVGKDINNLYSLSHIKDTSIVSVTFTPVGDNKYEIGLGGPEKGSSAYKLLEENGKVEELDGLDYGKALLRNPSADTMDILRESIRRLAISTGAIPDISFPYRETGATAGVQKGRFYTADQVEAKFSKAPLLQATKEVQDEKLKEAGFTEEEDQSTAESLGSALGAGVSAGTGVLPDSDTGDETQGRDNAGRVRRKFAKSPTGEYDSEINPLGLKEHNGQAELAAELEEKLNGEYQIIPWRMPDSLVRTDKKGRVHMAGVPRSDFELSERLGKILEKEIVWMSAVGDGTLNGLMVGSGPLSKYIFVDVRSKIPSHVIYGHELSHHLETEHPQQYQDLFDIVSPLIKDVDKYRDKLHLRGDDAFIKREIIADLLGDSFDNPAFWNEVAAQSPSKFRKIAAKIRAWIDDLIAKFSARGFGSEQYVTDLKATRKALAGLMVKTMSEKGRKELANSKAGILKSFAGPRATSAATSALSRAKQMQKSGDTRRAIWRETGWYEIIPGKGQWSYEIDDSLSSVKMKDGYLEDVLSHPKLYADYPELAKVRVKFEDLGWTSRGNFNKDIRIIRVNSEMSSTQKRSVLHHELQHFLQTQEGTPAGANFSYHKAKLSLDNDFRIKIFNTLKKQHPDIAKILDAWDKDVNGRGDKYYEDQLNRTKLGGEILDLKKSIKDNVEEEAYSQYASTTGEAESRLVQARLDMTPAQRKAIPPWVTLRRMLEKEGLLKDGQKVEDVLVSGGGGVAQSVGDKYKAVDVNNPEFKRWFGDSKVREKATPGAKMIFVGDIAIDEKNAGAPLTVYHGTIDVFDEFSITQPREGTQTAALGYAFTENKVVANAYTKKKATIDYKDGWEGVPPYYKSPHPEAPVGSIIPVYLSIKKPFYITATDFISKFESIKGNPESQGERARLLRVKLEKEGYDGIIVIPNGKAKKPLSKVFQHYVFFVFNPSQIKSAISNTGAFSTSPNIMEDAGDIRYSKQYTASAPFIGSANTAISQAYDYLKSKGLDEKAEQIATYLWDADAAIARVQREVGPQPETRDYSTLKRLVGKRITDEIAKFDREVLQPLLQHMADNKLKVPDVEELGHAQHAEEANLQTKRVNARRYVDAMLQQMTDTEKAPYADRLIDIQDEFVMNDQTRNQKRDNTVALMDEISELVIDTHDAERAKIDAEMADVSTRIYTAEELMKGTPERLMKLLTNRSERLGRRHETAKYWEDVKDRLSGMTNERAEEIKQKWAGNAAIQEAVDTLHDINTSRLEMLHDSGELGDDEYKAISETYQNYVPLMREGMEDSKNPTGRAGTGPLAKPIKVRAGSTKNVVDIFANTIDLYQAAVSRKYKNEAGRALYEMVKANPDEDRWSIIEQDKIAYYDNEGNIRYYTDQKEGDNEVYVKIDGVKYLISVPKDNKSMRRFMDAIKRKPVELGPVLTASRYVTRIMAALNTSLSPEFILTNFMRDIQTASVHLQTTDAAGMQRSVYKGLKSAIKGIYAAERGDESSDMAKWYRDFSKHGGKIAWMQSYENVADLAKTIGRELEYKEGKHPNKMKLRKLGKFVEAMNTSIENGVRLATYKVLVENGSTKFQAAKAASNLTVDFTRHGTAGPIINSLYMFANAGIQGNVRMIKAVAKNRSVQKIAGGIVAFGFTANILGAMSGDDDDDEAYYDKLKRTNPSIFERNMVFMIPGTDGRYVKIPMPYGYNTFFVLGNEAAGALRGKSPVESMSRIMSTLLGSLNPLQSATLLQTIMPTIGDPIAQVMENKAWHGGKLMPDENPFGIPIPDSERFFKSVNPMAKFVAQGLNAVTGGDKYKPGLIDMSPETFEMIVETYGGSAAKLIKDAVSLPLAVLSDDGLSMNKTPGIRKFIGSSPDFIDSTIYEENNDKVDILKKRYEDAEGAEKSDLKSDPLFKMLSFHKITKSQLRRMNKQMKLAEKAGNKGTEKRLKEQILQVKKRYNAKYNSVTK